MIAVDAERAKRAHNRAGWPGVVTTLAGQSDAAIVRHGTAAERIAMVWRVTLDDIRRLELGDTEPA